MKTIHRYWVYIMSNKSRSVIYTGVTNDIYRRYLEHRDEKVPGFTQKYKCHNLIYYEEHNFIEQAIHREKEIKGWRREKKMELIRTINPWLKDLAEGLGWTKSPSESQTQGH